MDHSDALVLPPLLLESAVKVEDDSIKPLYLMELLKRQTLLSDLQSAKARNSPDNDSSDSGTESSGSLGDPSLTALPKSSKGQALPTSMDSPRGVLIFTKSNESALRLSRLIALLSPSTSEAIGTLTSTTRTSSRKATLSSFSAGHLSILVASDLVSRGLDLPNLAHVVNYDVPTSLTSYVHRIGRTARAGKQGHAWTLFTAIEGRWFWNEIGRTTSIERASGVKVERVNIAKESFCEEERTRYEAALDQLGQEAAVNTKF